MSSDGDHSDGRTKKRKIQRACDTCRQKKSDEPELSGEKCSECIAQSTQCTYTGVQFKRRYSNEYVEGLQRRLEHMEKYVAQLDLNDETAVKYTGYHTGNDDNSQNVSSFKANQRRSPPNDLPLAITPQTPSSSDDIEYPSDDDVCVEEVVEGLREMTVESDVYRYHGKSSGLVFIRSAIDLKKPCDQRRAERPERPYSRSRPTFEEESPVFTDYPPEDLLDSLVELYFRNVNDATPLLHEPTFRAALADGMHHRHGGFGGTVLLVCANAARFSRDPRVKSHSPEAQQPAGWEWFKQVQRTRTSTLAPAQSYDLQTYALMAIFVQSKRAPHAVWPFVGAGIRMAIDAGVHRRKMYGTTQTVEGELWRRAFWILVYFEWHSAYALGRPASINDEDINLDFPAEVDDEYWTSREGDPLFKQPPGKPSKVSFFVWSLKLGQMLAFASRTLYSSNKSRAKLERGDTRWEEQVVADLDSALNKWSDSLPAHLRWNPDCEDQSLLIPSSSIQTHYYHVQMEIHRPFISAARRDSPLSFPSLVICLSAARSVIHMIYALYTRTGSPQRQNMGTLFMSSVVLLMNVINQKHLGRPHNASSDMELVRKVIEMLNVVKNELLFSDALSNLLRDILNAANAPANPQGPVSAKKPSDALSSRPTAQPSVTSKPRTITTNAIGPVAPPLPAPSIQSINIDVQGHAIQEHDMTHYPSSSTSPLSSQDGLPNRTHADMRLPPTPPLSTHSQEAIATLETTSLVHAFTSNGAQVPVTSGQYAEYQYQNELQSLLGLDMLGHNEHMSPFTASNAPQAPPFFPTEDLFPPSLPSFNPAAMDEAMNMWSSVPSAYGWDDWTGLFGQTNEGAFNSTS